MAKFTVYTADIAPEAGKPSLKAAKASFGFIPDLQATMAEPYRPNQLTLPASFRSSRGVSQ
jgi:hypothetical protein